MADVPAAPAPDGTSSTPSAASAAATLYPSAKPTEAPAAAATPATPVSATAAEPAKPVEPAAPEVKPAEPAPADAPLFVLPEDFKPPETMVAQFADSVKGKLIDGKLQMTPQEVADLYVAMARGANADWQKQVEDTNKANEVACKSRFSAEELTAAETAVGWFSSFEPAFRDFSKRQLNDPTFTNAMRIVGELLSEDEFPDRPATPAPAKKTPAQRMGYDKRQ